MFLEIGNKFKQLYRWFIKPSPRLLGALSNYAKWSFIQYLIFTGLSWLVRNYVFQNKALLQNDPEFSSAIAQFYVGIQFGAALLIILGVSSVLIVVIWRLIDVLFGFVISLFTRKSI